MSHSFLETAFCIDSSSHGLSNQYLIRDHMAAHYNKILSAKAAVDCSVPKSRLNSIKFSDQQRREKLKKKVEKCEKEMISSKNVSRSSSRESRRPLSAANRKDSLQGEDMAGRPSCAPSEERYMLANLSSPERQSMASPSIEKRTRKTTQRASNISTSSSNASASSLQRLHSKLSYNSSSDSFASRSSQAQNVEPKTTSGDLLDKHSKHFTSSQRPFTPRTLKSDAKSFLSQYRYYMPPRHKIRRLPKKHKEAETQTDISSFQVKLEEIEARETEKGETADFQKNMKEIEEPAPANADKSDEMKAVSQFFSPRVTSPCSVQSPGVRKIQAEEEELLYLHFIQDITDEILRLGLFSNRALQRLFERHIKQNKNHLDEMKMRHLLEILKVDLGCKKGGNAVGGLNEYDLLTEEEAQCLQLHSEVQREGKVTKREELLKGKDFVGNEPVALNDQYPLIESPKGVPRDPHEPASVEAKASVAGKEPDTLSALVPISSSTPFDTDSETSDSLRGGDELRESFAE